MSEFIQLHPQDNVLVCVSTVEKGAAVNWGSVQLHLDADIGVGHKIAARAISAGEKIVKYGVPIGSALQDIAAGAHVHSHNIKSDYLASHSREQFVRGEEQ